MLFYLFEDFVVGLVLSGNGSFKRTKTKLLVEYTEPLHKHELENNHKSTFSYYKIAGVWT